MTAAKSYLSANLRFLLKQHGISTAELARRCNIAQPVLHRLVAGDIDNPQINTLLPVIAYFNCPLDHLLRENLSAGKNTVFNSRLHKLPHRMRSTAAIINSTLAGMQKLLPALLNAYHVLPKRMRSEQLSSKVLALLPEMLENASKMIEELKQDINFLGHSFKDSLNILKEKDKSK